MQDIFSELLTFLTVVSLISWVLVVVTLVIRLGVRTYYRFHSVKNLPADPSEPTLPLSSEYQQ